MWEERETGPTVVLGLLSFFMHRYEYIKTKTTRSRCSFKKIHFVLHSDCRVCWLRSDFFIWLFTLAFKIRPVSDFSVNSLWTRMCKRTTTTPGAPSRCRGNMKGRSVFTFVSKCQTSESVSTRWAALNNVDITAVTAVIPFIRCICICVCAAMRVMLSLSFRMGQLYKQVGPGLSSDCSLHCSVTNLATMFIQITKGKKCWA